MFRSVCFDLLGDASAGLLARVLNPFARRDLVLDQVKARRFGESQQVTLALEMPDEAVALVEGNLRQIVGVQRVEVTLRGAVRAA